MKSGKILFTSLLLLGLLVHDAVAAQKGLILLGTLEHSTDLSYQYGRQDVSGGGRSVSSSQNRFQEIYNLDTNFALYNERIFKARVSAKAKAEQEFFSTSVTRDTSTKNLGFLYNIYGVILERGYTPVKLTTLAEQTRVSNSFSNGYDLYTRGFGIGTAVRNKIFPMALDYTRYTNRTEGLAQDREQTNSQISLTGSHVIPSISQTDLLMYRTDTASELEGGGGGDEDQRSFQAQLKNSLTTRDNNIALYSGLRVREEVDRVKSGNLSWQESLSWRLGKALTMGLGFGTDTSSQEEVDGATTRRSSQSGNFSLAHQLFLNLTTRLDLSGRWAELSNGTEDEYSGMISVNYSRSLPRDARLTLNYNQLRSLVDRKLTSSEAFAIDERLAASRFEINQLRQPNVVAGTVVVRDATTRELYSEPAGDYRLVTVGAFTRLEIPDGSPIVTRPNISVVYRYLVNPSLEYLTTTHSVSSSLFWGGRHRLYASYDQSGQELVSGRTDLLELNDSIGISLGFNSEIYRIAYGIENNYVDSTLDKHNATEAFARVSMPFRYGILVGQLRDRYAMYGETAANPESRQENTFSATANYTRPLFRTGVLVVTGSFADTRGGRFSRDDAELGADFTWSYSKLFLKLTGKLNWRDLAGVTSLENYLTFELKRYF